MIRADIIVNNQIMFSQLIDKVFSTISQVPFDTLIWIIAGSYAGIFLLTFILSLALPAMRAASKRPFLSLSNAYAAVILAAFLTANELPQAILAAALFWCAGYILYGLLCLITRPVAMRRSTVAQVAVSSLPESPVPQKPSNPSVPAAKNVVRLDHAISVTDKLLDKNLGKGDRQELEKLKNTFTVLEMKGSLSPTESDILNDNFNALLKLMAKYNV